MRKLAPLLLACLFAGFLTGCAANGADGDERDTLVVMSVHVDFQLDPTSGGLLDHSVLPALFDTLVKMGPTGEIVPLLAESFEVIDGGSSIRFHLNPNATFHDGSRITADDVVYSFETKLEKPQFTPLLGTFGRVEAVDDSTVIVYAAMPFVNLLELLAHQFYVLPRAHHEPDPIAFLERPIGSGPFTFISHDIDGTLHLQAFEDYHGRPSAFRYLTIRPSLDPSSAVVSLETGEVDFIPSIPPAQARILIGNDDLNHLDGMSFSCALLVMMGDTLNNDINLRRAIYYAINRQSVIDIANEGIGEPPTTPFAPIVMGDFADVIPIRGHDLERARHYLELSNYNGEELTITTAVMPSVALSVQADLRELGINIQIEQVDHMTWLTRLRNGELEVTIVNFGAGGLRSMGENLQFFEYSGRFYGLFTERNSVFENLMEQIYVEADSERRFGLLTQALNTFMEHYVTVNLMNMTVNYSFSRDIFYDYPISPGLDKYFWNFVERAN